MGRRGGASGGVHVHRLVGDYVHVVSKSMINKIPKLLLLSQIMLTPALSTCCIYHGACNSVPLAYI